MARFGRLLLIGVVIFISLGLPPLAPAATAAAPVTLALSATGGGSASADPPGPAYEAGAIVTLTATPDPGNLFVGWTIDGVDAGWANPRKLVMDADHAVIAAFAPRTAFTDLPANAAEREAIGQISALGIIRGYTPAGCAARGVGVPCFGPQDTVLRGEIAAMIVRALGWEDIVPTNAEPFSDLGGIDPELRLAIAILASQGVMQGYGDGTAGPTSTVLRIQVVSLITRAMVKAGYWQAETTDNPAIYPNIPASSDHRLDLVTFVKNAGPIPDRPQDQAWADWLAPAPRAWTARLLWQALDSYFTGGPFNPNPTNTPPTTTADAYTIAEGTPLIVAVPGVLGNDSDPNGDALTAVLGTGPTHAASFALAADGSFAYTPVVGYTGPDSFTYQARDPSAALSATTTVAITVAPGEPAPTVTATMPTTGATNVAEAADLAITFSEPVNVAGAWFQIACGTSGAHTAAVTGGATDFVLNPDTDFAPGESCTVTIVASQVTDADTDDPFDAMAANFVFSFTVEAPPAVTATVPANGASSVAANTNIAITFSEPVAVAGEWFQFLCTVSGTLTVGDTVVSGGPTIWTIDPNADLVGGESCTVTVFAAQVADTDAADPPDTMLADYVFSFGPDAPPAVTGNTPLDNAPGVATTAAITVTFSKPVNATIGSFAIECPVGTSIVFALSASPATTFTLTPAATLPANTTCTVTVVAAQISDVDTDDPPDNMVADHVFDFTTDAAPEVTTTAPANNATGILTGAAITINFSESVAATTGSFTIECPVGPSRAFALGTSPASSFTLTPTAPLPAGTICTVTVLAAEISDTDSDDPPDTLAANAVFSFTTLADDAPFVTTTAPTNGGNAALDADITVTFSESVDVAGEWFSIACPTSGTRAVAATVVTGGPTTWTIDPNADFVAGESCTVTIFAAQVTDVDTAEPPDAMLANYAFTFIADAAPTVLSTAPADTATGVATNTAIAITFSEPVSATGASFTLACPVGTPVPFAVGGSGTATVTLTPGTPLPVGITCTVTALAAGIADQDGTPTNLAADYTFSFTTDSAPAVTGTTPANGVTDIAVGENIAITFSEAVTATGMAFTIECPVGTPIAFAAIGSGTDAITLNPTADLPAGVTCTVTVVAAQITDTDANDPPDTMAADYLFTFTTDAAPTVLSTTPANAVANVATDAPIAVIFSEAVTATDASFTLACPTGTPVPFAVGGSGTATVTLTPGTPLPVGAVCTVTVIAAQIADVDGNDPPDTMAANYVFSFTVDTPPSVLSTTPINGATGVATNTTIAISFSESVNAATGSFQIECPTGSGALAFALTPASPAASYTLTPSVPLSGGTVCTVTVLAAQISDADSGDPPDNMAANYVFSFSVPPVATADNYTQQIIGNVGVNTAAAGGTGFSILANDTPTTGLTIATDGTTVNGGTVSVAPSGTFTYTPPRGYTGADSFTYTVSNAAGTSAPATVSLTTISGMVWFVNNTAGACAATCGTLATPYPTLAAFNAANALAGGLDPDNGDSIFLYQSAAPYPGPLALRANQRLIGQDAGPSLASLAGLPSSPDSLTLPAMDAAGTAATIGGTGITLNSGNQLHGFTLNTTTGTAITGAAFGTLTVSTVTVSATGGSALSLTTGTLAGNFTSLTSTGGTSNILLSGVTASGTVALGTGALSGATGASFSVSGGSGTVTYGGTITGGAGGAAVGIAGGTASLILSGNVTQASNAALLNVTGAHGGSLTFQTGTLSATSGTGLQFDNADGTYTFSGPTTLNGGDAGIDILGGSSGTFSFVAGTTITDPTNQAIRIESSAPTFTYSGAFTKTNNGNVGILAQNNTGGTIAFNGTAVTKSLSTGAGNAVNLLNNTGATINFTNGGLAITTTTGNGFNATGGGTVTVGTGASPNTIASTGGVALNVANTTIGAGGLTFRSIAANGGANGIVLNNTGASGGLIVTGTGASLASGTRGTVGASLGTGGTIQSTTGDAIALNNVDGGVTLRSMVIGAAAATTSEGKDTAVNIAGDGIDIVGSDNIVLENVKIARTGGHGIEGIDVTNFSLRNSEVINAGNANDEDGLNFAGGIANQLDGTVVFDDCIFSASAENNIYVSNGSGTVTITVDNSLFTRTANTAALINGEEGLKLETFAGGSPSITATVTSSTFDNLESDGITVAANAGTITLVASANTFTGVDTSFGESDNAISLGTSGSATLRFNVHDNTLNNSYNSAVIFNFNDNAIVHGIFEDNQIVGSIGNAGGRGIDGALVADDNANVRLRVDGNTITGMRGEGMFFNANNTATLHIQVTNNNITTSPIVTSTFENLAVQAAGGAASSIDIVAKIEGNTVKKGGDGGIGGGYIAEAIRLSAGVSGTNTIQLEQGGQPLATAVRAVLDANNPNAEPGTDSGLGVDVQPAPDGGGKITVVANGTVLQPQVP